MHGLINRSLQCFLRDTYGEAFWRSAAQAAGLGEDGFEAMLTYDDDITQTVVIAASAQLGKSMANLLEDLGTYLVCHPNTQALRRLLRFSGETFSDFLFSLDDLPERARLAVSDLKMPQLETDELAPGNFRVRVVGPEPAYAFVLTGVLRAMADDYGALVLIDFIGPTPEGDIAAHRGFDIDIALLDRSFAEDKGFSLASALGDEPKAATA